ncbi:MAG: hypothetical protein AAFV80_07725, partial [Bacteroidota bacterium]
MTIEDTPTTTAETTTDVGLSRVQIGSEDFLKISNFDAMRPFFMSIVSDSDHWMFISSNGGLTAGRKNSEFALFPYYTDDKITESAEITGHKAIFRVNQEGDAQVWEPFSYRFDGRYRISRNLYKNVYGNKVLFEEVNHDLGLTFQYQWNSSDRFGFVKRSELINHSGQARQVALLDGIQNILPAGVNSDLQMRSSNLVDAYKRNELDTGSGLGIYALSAFIVDKAEPSEALKANVAWSVGLPNAQRLVSSLQVNHFRRGFAIHGEDDVKAEKGAYFVHAEINLPAGASERWMLLTDANKNHSAIASLIQTIHNTADLGQQILADIQLGTQKLIQLNASSDALQQSNDYLSDTRHFSNTLFNIMRGGIFDYNYQVEKWDFEDYLSKANRKVYAAFKSILAGLPADFSLFDLKALAQKHENEDFKRLCLEYLPLKFSRRHGDPSRPWNRFSINTRSEVDGSKILDYEGNWRDIFQNWEALAVSFPAFIESMIHKFLNASTFDGYNPYRVVKMGFDWETIEPDDPWSYIGYWGDHQIIYLQKFLEIIENQQPGQLDQLFNDEFFVYANVPYKIKDYASILKNSKDTIDFDLAGDEQIRERRQQIGVDGALLTDRE